MNYSEIIEQGIINDNTREHLEQYFTREFNKANSENFIEADEFYNGCLKVLKNWEAHLQEKVYKRKCDLQLMLSTAKENKESFEIYENELKNEREDGIGSETYTINLNRLTNGRLGYNMEFSELLFIKDAINKAYFNTYNFYSVTDLKEVFSDNKLIAVTYSNKDKLRHKFDLKNGNIYHKETKYLLKVEDRTKLNTSFHLKFERMYILNVSPFLNYQYSKSNNRKELLKYVERAVLNSKMIKHKGVKQEIAEWVQIIKNDKKQEKESTAQPHRKEKIETLSDIITNENSVEIVSSVKVNYKNIRGKRLKILLLAFQDLKLIPKDRFNKRFYDCCKKEFDWAIGSYNAMNGYKYNEITDNTQFIEMKEFINKLIKTK